MPLPSRPGTYALIFTTDADLEIQVGRLGQLHVRPGVYVYVGSAHGPGGLAARVLRHARTGKPLHWHVDYLREVVDLREVWYTVDPQRQECRWAKAIHAIGGVVPQERFGASDCSCPAHLLYFKAGPSCETFRRRLHRSPLAVPPIRCLAAELLLQ
jgi:Uri superfamily endonuclease